MRKKVLAGLYYFSLIGAAVIFEYHIFSTWLRWVQMREISIHLLWEVPVLFYMILIPLLFIMTGVIGLTMTDRIIARTSFYIFISGLVSYPIAFWLVDDILNCQPNRVIAMILLCLVWRITDPHPDQPSNQLVSIQVQENGLHP
ncbi:MAG TPA: hypothetical protein VMY36_04425 [Patescibacteria group bacterium]|nr:hypothetical protein [Patescibacteria group bacterium]